MWLYEYSLSVANITGSWAACIVSVNALPGLLEDTLYLFEAVKGRHLVSLSCLFYYFLGIFIRLIRCICCWLALATFLELILWVFIVVWVHSYVLDFKFVIACSS